MTTPFDYYSRTPRGQRLAAIINDPVRYAEFHAFSREGFPAVTALVSLVKPELEALRHSNRREFDAAKQFVGWAVGVIMHPRSCDRRRVAGPRRPVHRRGDLERRNDNRTIAGTDAPGEMRLYSLWNGASAQEISATVRRNRLGMALQRRPPCQPA